MSHYIKALVAVWAIALAVAGASYATSILQVHNGQNIRTGKILCVVRGGAITCGADPQHVMATVSKAGATLMVGQKVKYVCLNSGVCVRP